MIDIMGSRNQNYSPVVVIPVYKQEISHTELLSLMQCLSLFTDYRVCLVGPESLDYSCFLTISDQLQVEKFPDRYFVSLGAYSALLLAEEYYSRFAEHDYMLICQLDAFAFTNQLEYWCGKGYDYIGAPWRDDSGNLSGVGNGGFSLRRIAACLQVLQSTSRENPEEYWDYLRQNTSTLQCLVRYPVKIIKHMGIGTDLKSFLRKYIRKECPEDRFWGIHARRFLADFIVAPTEEAIRFSVEAGLEDCMDIYSETPPFGCHREWYLEMLLNYINSELEPATDYEKQVWRVAKIAGIERKKSSIASAETWE